MKTLSIISATIMSLGLTLAATSETLAGGNPGGRGFSDHGFHRAHDSGSTHYRFDRGNWRGGHGGFGGYSGGGDSSCFRWNQAFSRWDKFCE